jgi:hypothetical protein
MRRSNLDGRREALASSVGGQAYALGYVESLNDARTLHGKRRVSARRGRAGENERLFQHPVRGESRRGVDEGRVSSGYA